MFTLTLKLVKKRNKKIFSKVKQLIRFPETTSYAYTSDCKNKKFAPKS